VLLWKYIHKQGSNHFNVFTVDLNEERVAFYGGTLQEQTEFVYKCIKKIFSLYAGSNRPKSVAIVAHSMGGIVARGLFALPSFDRSLINSIVMLATPNIAPVVSADKYLAAFYAKVNSFWSRNKKQLQHVMLVSVGGGDHDFQVPTPLTRLPGNSTSSMFSTVATAVPYVGVSAEHQTIVWCNQLVLVTARFLESLRDPNTKQITTDIAQRRRSIDHYFKRNPGTSYVPNSNKPRTVRLSPSYAWKEVDALLWSVDKAEAGTGTYFSFAIEELVSTSATNFVSRTDTKRDKWILACKSTADGCQVADNLSHLGFIAADYRLIHLNLAELADQYTHIILPASHASSITTLDVNILSDLEISDKIIVPHVFSNLWTWNKGQAHHLSDHNLPSRFYYRVELDGFHNIYQAFRISVLGAEQDPLFRVEVPWDEGQTTISANYVVAKLLSIRKENEPNVKLHIYARSSQPLLVRVKVEFFEVLGSIIRYFGIALPAYIISNVMLTYAHQVNQLHLSKPCHSLQDAHAANAKPFKVQPFFLFFRHFSSYAWFSAVWTALQLPRPDAVVLEEQHRMWFMLAPFVLFLYAFELFTVFRLVQTAFLQLLGPVVSGVSKLAFVSVLQTKKTVKFVMHSTVLALLLSVHSNCAFLYIYCVSFLCTCLAKREASAELRFPQNLTAFEKGKLAEGEAKELSADRVEDDKKNDVGKRTASADSETKSATANSEAKLDPDTDPAGNGREEQVPSLARALQPADQPEPKPTTALEDCYSVNFVVMQFWLWLFLLSLPSFGAMLISFRYVRFSLNIFQLLPLPKK